MANRVVFTEGVKCRWGMKNFYFSQVGKQEGCCKVHTETVYSIYLIFTRLRTFPIDMETVYTVYS